MEILVRLEGLSVLVTCAARSLGSFGKAEGNLASALDADDQALWIVVVDIETDFLFLPRYATDKLEERAGVILAQDEELASEVGSISSEAILECDGEIFAQCDATAAEVDVSSL